MISTGIPHLDAQGGLVRGQPNLVWCTETQAQELIYSIRRTHDQDRMSIFIFGANPDVIERDLKRFRTNSGVLVYDAHRHLRRGKPMADQTLWAIVEWTRRTGDTALILSPVPGTPVASPEPRPAPPLFPPIYRYFVNR